MKTTLPLARGKRAWLALLPATLLSAFVVQAAPNGPTPAPPRERLGNRVLNFIRSIGEEDEPKKRQEPAPQPPPAAKPLPGPIAPAVGESSRVDLDKPPPGAGLPPDAAYLRDAEKEKQRAGNASAPATASEPPAPKKKKAPHPSSTDQNAKPSPQDPDAAKKELAELKRKVAAMEAQLAQTTGEGNVAPAPASSGSITPTTHLPAEIENPKETKPSAPTPPLPHRSVEPKPAEQPKKSFATVNPLTPASVPPPVPTEATAPAKDSSSTSGTTTGASANAPVPVATKTDKPGIVKSPHPPFNEVNVAGLQKGTLAKDPTTQKVFRVP